MVSQKADVGIHKKKIEQVENWLREALDVNEFVKRYRVCTWRASAGSQTTLTCHDDLCSEFWLYQVLLEVESLR